MMVEKFATRKSVCTRPRYTLSAIRFESIYIYICVRWLMELLCVVSSSLIGRHRNAPLRALLV